MKKTRREKLGTFLLFASPILLWLAFDAWTYSLSSVSVYAEPFVIAFFFTVIIAQLLRVSGRESRKNATIERIEARLLELDEFAEQAAHVINAIDAEIGRFKAESSTPYPGYEEEPDEGSPPMVH